MTDTWSVRMGPEHEVLGAELPPEPAVGTVVVDANGKVYQRVRLMRGGSWGYRKWTAWVGTATDKHAWRDRRPLWTELLNRGRVTIVWRAGSDTEEPPNA